MNWFDKAMWAFQGLLTQTNAGGGNLRLNIFPASRMVFLWGNVQVSDFAADRNLEAWVADADGDIIQQIVAQTPLDNERVPLFPASHVLGSPVVDKEVADRTNILVMARGDRLSIQAAALVQNENYTVSIRALIDAKLPTFTTTGSTGTATLVENYNKVI